MPLVAKTARHCHTKSHVSVFDRRLVRMSWQDVEAAGNAQTMTGHPDFVKACATTMFDVLNTDCGITYVLS